jgi:hypothetical protein
MQRVHPLQPNWRLQGVIYGAAVALALFFVVLVRLRSPLDNELPDELAIVMALYIILMLAIPLILRSWLSVVTINEKCLSYRSHLRLRKATVDWTDGVVAERITMKHSIFPREKIVLRTSAKTLSFYSQPVAAQKIERCLQARGIEVTEVADNSWRSVGSSVRQNDNNPGFGE